jgi:hypothetical protein
MSTTIWDKYLPILRIVIKRSLLAEQKFAFNAPDFERAGFKRKSGYRFMIVLRHGRLDNVLTDMPLASSFASALLGDPVIKEFVSEREIHLSMNSKFELTVKHPAQEEKPEVLAVAEGIN